MSYTVTSVCLAQRTAGAVPLCAQFVRTPMPLSPAQVQFSAPDTMYCPRRHFYKCFSYGELQRWSLCCECGRRTRTAKTGDESILLPGSAPNSSVRGSADALCDSAVIRAATSSAACYRVAASAPPACLRWTLTIPSTRPLFLCLLLWFAASY